MAKIYFKDGQYKKVLVEVSDEMAKSFKDSLRQEWRSDAQEKYHTVSLDRIKDTGRELADLQSDVAEAYEEREAAAERAVLLDKLKSVLPMLTELQRQTIHKLFVLNMSQSQIAREEEISEQAVSDRVERLFAKLKKLLSKF